ncbi:MAG: hypothetical protein AAGH99_05780 [Planctomycetota bacterium]
MKNVQFYCIFALSIGLVLGCEEAQTPATQGPASADEPDTALSDSVGDALNSLQEKATEAGDAVKAAGAEALESGKQQIEEAVESGKAKIHEMTAPSEDATEGLTLDSLKEGMSLDATQVDSLIAKVKSLIGEKNFDDAQQWISKLESVQLPEGYADQIAGLKDLLEKTKGASSLLNGLGG